MIIDKKLLKLIFIALKHKEISIPEASELSGIDSLSLMREFKEYIRDYYNLLWEYVQICPECEKIERKKKKVINIKPNN